MPTYQYQCDTCAHVATKIFAIADYDTENLVEAPCGQKNEEGFECRGTYEYFLAGSSPGHSFKGEGWTPKFHFGANQGGKA